VAAIGVEMGVVTPAVNAAVVFVSLVSVLVAPPLFYRLLPQQAERERRGVIVAGSTPQARLLAQRLRRQGERVVVLTANRHLASEIESLSLPVVLTDPGSRSDRLDAVDAEHARVLVSMLDDDEESLRLTTKAQDAFGVETVVAQVKDPRMAERFHGRGIYTVDPSLSPVLLLQALIQHPHVFSLLTRAEVEGHLVEVRLGNPRLEGLALSTVRLPGDALVMMIVRRGEVIVPRGHTRLVRHDLLTVIGSEDAVRAARTHLGA
jgi:Trk K+ transport system NAD-binding subunit